MMNGRDRPRGPPSGDLPPPQRDPRRGADGRNGGMPAPADSSMSRAEKFEDEKKRIIQSCFARKDNDGTCMWFTSSRTVDVGLAIVMPRSSQCSTWQGLRLGYRCYWLRAGL